LQVNTSLSAMGCGKIYHETEFLQSWTQFLAHQFTRSVAEVRHLGSQSPSF
jgi:hypothetical protein